MAGKMHPTHGRQDGALREVYSGAGIYLLDLDAGICPSSSSTSPPDPNSSSTHDAQFNCGQLSSHTSFASNMSLGTAEGTHYLPTGALKSRIPWLSDKIKPCQEEDCKLVLDVVNQNRNLLPQKTLKLYDLFNSLQDMVPYYLSSRYHKMDCLSLCKRTKSIGNYWVNAVQYVITNTMLGIQVLTSIDNQLTRNPPELEHKTIFICNLLKDKYIQNLENVEDCKSAEEYLLEPWVLLQLPFEPVILHQWAVALLAEALTFQKKITDFYTMAYPEHLKIAVNKLIAIASLLLNGANTFLTFIAKEISVKDTSSNHMHAAATLYFEKFQEILPPVLSALKFVLSEDCGTVILTLKRMAWNENADERTCTSNIDFEIIPSIYSDIYWRSHQMQKGLFFENESEPAPHSDTIREESKDLDADLVNYLIDEKIIKMGRLRGVQKETIFKIAATWELLDHYKHFVGLTKCAIYAADKGVIYDILKLYAEVKIEEAVGLTTQSLCDLTKKEVLTSKIYIDVGISVETKMTLEDVEQKLNKAFLSSDWIYKNLIGKTRATCFSPQRTHLPDRDVMTTEEIAEHFQERIQNMVFKMIEKQYESLLKGPPYHYHPEIVSVQYILPCFVASYLEMESTNESDQAKEEYLQFVHQLVKNYEQNGFCLELAEAKVKKDYFEVYEKYEHCFNWDFDKRYENVTNVLENMAPFLYKHVISNCLSHIYAFAIKQNSNGNNSWFDQKHMIFQRIHAALDKLGKIESPPAYQIAALGVVLSNLIPEQLIDSPKLQKLMSVLKYRIDLSAEKAIGIYSLEHQTTSKPPNSKLFYDLNDTQLFNLVYFFIFREWFVRRKVKIGSAAVSQRCERVCFPLDKYGELFWCIVENDWWKLKILGSKYNIDTDGVDQSLIPYNLAKNLKCCEDLIRAIDKNHKIEMKNPGAITFFPIKHCRWCGLVVVQKFRLCPECKDNSDYPDQNYFCSEKCEAVCLKNQHTEEHIQYLIMKLSM